MNPVYKCIEIINVKTGLHATNLQLGFRLRPVTNYGDHNHNTRKKARQSIKIREEPKIVLMEGVKIPFPSTIDLYATQRLMMFRIIQSLKTKKDQHS